MDQHRKQNPSIDLEHWVRACDEAFAAELDEVAQRICTEDGVRLIRLSGPTCSGKTTVANMLTARFGKLGKNMHLVSIDDFYYDKDVLHAAAKNFENGEVDYDSVKTIDLEALRTFVEEVFFLERSHCPVFDFKQGRRIGYRLIESGADDVFVFEGIQAVYPEVTEIFASSGHGSVGIYIAPQTAVEADGVRFEPNELRLLRRLVRDYNFRGTQPVFTLGLWSGVRRNEETHIFPYADDCQYRIDSSMPYELGVLKPYLCRILPTVPEKSPHRKTAEEILTKISAVEEISDRLILPGSLYKEFI